MVITFFKILLFLEGLSNTFGSGVNWQVVSVFAPPVGADSVIGVLPKKSLPGDVVYEEELEGRETDFFGSYSNAFYGLTDKRGAIVFYKINTKPVSDNDAIDAYGQPDIQDDTTAGIAFGAIMRGDRDPNNLVWDTAFTAADFPSGKEL